MGLAFSKIDGKSREFYILLILFSIFTLIGFICFMVSYVSGHHVLGSSSIIPWGMPITITIYLIGLSAGSLILSALTYVFGKEEYRPIARLAVFLAIILIFGAMIGIALDLGRPEKSWRLFMFFVLNNMRSMFAVNGILYGGYFLIGVVYLGTIFVPFLIMVVPVAIVFTQLDQRYSRSFLTPGETALLSVQLKEGLGPFETAVELHIEGGATPRGKPVRDAVTRETDWQILVDAGGMPQVTLYAKGASYSFPLVAESTYRMIGSERRVTALFEPILHPGLPPIPLDSPFQRIRVEYPPASHWLLGWHVHWIVIFLVYSVLAAFALKILVGIEI